MRNVIRSIEDKAIEREKRLELGLEANRDIESALQWWEEASRILCRQASDPHTTNLSILEQKILEYKELRLLQVEYDSFVNVQYSARLTKTILQVQELAEQYEKKISSSRTGPKPVQPVEPRLVELKPAVDSATTDSNEYATTEESGEECAKSPSGSVRNRGSEKNSGDSQSGRDSQNRRNLQGGQRLNASLTAVVMSSSAVCIISHY